VVSFAKANTVARGGRRGPINPSSSGVEGRGHPDPPYLCNISRTRFWQMGKSTGASGEPWNMPSSRVAYTFFFQAGVCRGCTCCLYGSCMTFEGLSDVVQEDFGGGFVGEPDEAPVMLDGVEGLGAI